MNLAKEKIVETIVEIRDPSVENPEAIIKCLSDAIKKAKGTHTNVRIVAEFTDNTDYEGYGSSYYSIILKGATEETDENWRIRLEREKDSLERLIQNTERTLSRMDIIKGKIDKLDQALKAKK
jgi:hypothetical protein